MVKKTDLEIVKKFKQNLAKIIMIRKLILFGSRANGNPKKWSDFDIVIVSDNFKGKDLMERGKGFHKKWGYKYPVDFLCYTPEEFENLKKKVTIVREAVKEGIEI